PVAGHHGPRRGGELEADGARAGIDGGVELVADLAAGALGHDRSVVEGEGGGADPGAHGHAAAELQRRAVAQVDEGAAAVERQRVAGVARRGPAGPAERAAIAVARGIGRRRPRSLAETVRRHQTVARRRLCAFRARTPIDRNSEDQDYGEGDTSCKTARHGRLLVLAFKSSPQALARPRLPFEAPPVLPALVTAEDAISATAGVWMVGQRIPTQCYVIVNQVRFQCIAIEAVRLTPPKARHSH